MTKAGSRIINAAEEALAFARGETKGFGVHTLEAVNVSALRQRMNMTQEAFAASFGLP
ncbi:MAG: hypothetical protein ACRCUE_00370 [Bosea sp. (in: a-proteobacteria)]